jgi:hypothetical protein
MLGPIILEVVPNQAKKGISMLRYLIIFIAVTLGAAVLVPDRTESSAPAQTKPAAAGNLLEELRYQVDVWVFKDAIDTKVTLKRLDQQRYRAEVNGKSVGLLGLLSGHWRGVYSTEMTLVDGKFMPLVYREESHHGSKKNLKEYRFDYDKKVVELFKWDRGQQKLTKRWQAALNEPMYDALSFYYNQRLEGMSFGKQGEILKFQGIPYPKPEDIVLRIGPDTPQGRKIMVTLDNRVFENERNHVYALLDKDGVPVEAWTDVMKFGRITGKLKPGSKRFNGRLLASGRTAEG